MLWWFAQTTLVAGFLAIVAALAGRWKRLGPEARHALWLLVLIKLAIPPFVAWPWAVPDAWPARVEPVVAAVAVAVPASVALPGPTTDAVPDSAPDVGPAPPADPPPALGAPPSPDEVLAGVEVAAEAPAPAVPDPPAIGSQPETPGVAPPPSPRPRGAELLDPSSSIGVGNTLLLALWLAGSVAVVARRGVKVFRFHRGLADSRPAPGWLIEEARAIGARVGVRPPPVLATPRVATPLLWCLGRPRLILPEALIKRLGADRWPGILAHELAHLARGDQWVVRLELLVEAAWWWNPLFWLARRRLHEEAELACDARVVRSLPGRRHDYAEALVDVCEHIARSAIPSPSLGVGGAGAAHSLEGRLNMILQDPLPGRPTRRSALLALLLAALALPAWTLGQQQPPTPPGRPEPPSVPTSPGPASPPPKPEGSPPPEGPPAKRPVVPGTPPPELQAPTARPPAPTPAPSSVTIDDILFARNQARQGLGNLSFRHVVAGRDEFRRDPLAGTGGMGGGVAPPVRRSKVVRVQVADVTLGLDGRSRLDVIEARPEPEGRPLASGPARPLAWDRRFVARGDSGYMALETSGDKDGPVPFRWLGANNRQGAFGDSLSSAFYRNPNPVDPDRGIDPLDPRPANILDLAGTSPLYLNANTAHAEVVGLETIDGREAVRVAWIANAEIGLRGLCWLAPDLGYAVVRSDATMDPTPANFGGPARGRRAWRMRSGDFVQVGNLRLPRKVTYEETEAGPPGGETVGRREREMTFEDYRVEPNPPADTFRPKLAIQALDDLSGNFTARPPELPPGLVDRLARAVAEGKFGPPVVEKSIDEPRAVAPSANTLRTPGGRPPSAERPSDPQNRGGKPPSAERPSDPRNPGNPIRSQPSDGSKPGSSTAPPNVSNGRKYADIVANVDEVPTGRLPFTEGRDGRFPGPSSGNEAGVRTIDPRFTPPGDAAKGDPGIIARPAPGFSDPIPFVDPKVNDPISAKGPADRAGLDRAIERRFRLDPEVVDLAGRVKDAQARLDAVAKSAARAGDPAEGAARRKLEGLKLSWQNLWDERSRKLLDEIDSDRARARDEIEVLQARRDGKAAEMQKAKALLALAEGFVRNTEKLRNRGGVSNDELAKVEGERAVAEAELAGKKAGLDEADALLNQARRRAGGTSAPKAPPDPLAGGSARPPFAEAEAEAEAEAVPNQARRRPSGSVERPSTQAELRDAVEVMEVQLQGKQAALRGEDLKVALSKARLDGMKANGLELQDSYRDAKGDIESAEVEREMKKAEALEAEVRLKQARRRLDANEALLRRDVERAKARLDWSEGLRKKGYVSTPTYEADKAIYDELMIQIDPKYVPAPSPPPTPGDQSKEAAEPGLSVRLAGEKDRVSGQAIDYKVSMINLAPAPLKDARLVVTLPSEGGKLVTLPAGAKFDAKDRKLTWSIPSLEPGRTIDRAFTYGTSTPGRYRTTALVTSGEHLAADVMTTDVASVTALDLRVTQTSRVMDVGKTNTYDIVIKNSGTKEATRLQLRGKLGGKLKILRHLNVEKGEFRFNPDSGEFVFPEIERLDVGRTITLGLEVQATEAGPAGCHVFLAHDGMGGLDAKVEDVISTAVVGTPREPAGRN